jgi:hypothetical protein
VRIVSDESQLGDRLRAADAQHGSSSGCLPPMTHSPGIQMRGARAARLPSSPTLGSIPYTAFSRDCRVSRGFSDEAHFPFADGQTQELSALESLNQKVLQAMEEGEREYGALKDDRDALAAEKERLLREKAAAQEQVGRKHGPQCSERGLGMHESLRRSRRVPVSNGSADEVIALAPRCCALMRQRCARGADGPWGRRLTSDVRVSGCALLQAEEVAVAREQLVEELGAQSARRSELQHTVDALRAKLKQQVRPRVDPAGFPVFSLLASRSLTKSMAQKPLAG